MNVVKVHDPLKGQEDYGRKNCERGVCIYIVQPRWPSKKDSVEYGGSSAKDSQEASTRQTSLI